MARGSTAYDLLGTIQTMVPPARYKQIFFQFMSFLDGIAYSADNDVSVERLATISTDDVVRYLHLKAFGTQHTTEEDNPPLCRYMELAYHKKAISYFMTLAGNRNPTRAVEVKNVLSKVKSYETHQYYLPPRHRTRSRYGQNGNRYIIKR